MIYDSNLKTLEEKLTAQANNDSHELMTMDASAKQMMETVQNLMNTLAEDPDNYDLNVQAGNANFDIGRFDKAIIYYKKAMSLHSHDPGIEIDLGVCYFNLNKLDSALIYMNSALKKQPDHKQGLYNIGVVLYNLGQIDAAIMHWKNLVRLYPESGEGQTANRFIEEIEKQKSGI